MTSKILIVDDDDLNREVMEAFLSFGGHAVIAVGNGKSAIKQAQSHLPDLIILDLRLPDMNGLEVCRYLKTNEITKSIPILMITGMPQREIFQEVQDAGVDVFLARPFEGDEFIEQVEALLAHDK